MQIFKIAERTFVANLTQEGSWGARSIGTHVSTMTLYDVEPGYCFLEWDIPDLEVCEEIGIWYEVENGKRVLTDYDGVFSLPKEAVQMLEEAGFEVGEDFK